MEVHAIARGYNLVVQHEPESQSEPERIANENGNKSTSTSVCGDNDAASSSVASQGNPVAQEEPESQSELAKATINTPAFDHGDNDWPSGSASSTSQGKSEAPQNPLATTVTWKESYWRYGPVSGIACILLAVTGLVSSFAVLIASNNRPQTDWRWKPATYIALFTAISNLGIRYAAVQGVTIGWWSQAVRKPTSLFDLHQEWEAGNGLLASLVSMRRLSLVGIACLASTLVAIDGPLLQQASTVALVSVPDGQYSEDLTFTIAQQVPRNFTGSLEWDPGLKMITSGESTRVLDAFMKNYTMDGFVSGCEKTCKASVRAPALTLVRCEKSWVPINYTTLQEGVEPADDIQGSWAANYAYSNRWNMVVNHSLEYDDGEYFNLTAMTAQTKDCVGTLNYTSCILRSSIAEYDVLVENDTIHLPGSVARPPLVALSNNTASISKISSNSTSVNVTILGLDHAIGMMDITTTIVKPSQFRIAEPGPYGLSLTDIQNVDSSRKACGNWTDPYDNVLDVMNRIMFWSGLVASSNYTTPSKREEYFDPGLTTEQTVKGFRAGTWNVYQTNFYWFIGAALVEILSIVLILPTYWRWWELGRCVSFSPLEIAKAFEAPILMVYDAHAESDKLAESGKDRLVQYGLIAGEADHENGAWVSSDRLAFGDPKCVSRPRKEEPAIENDSEGSEVRPSS